MPQGQVTEQNPIINDPYTEPTRHWEFGGVAPVLSDGRRAAGYLPPGDLKSGELDVTGDVVPLDLVNDLRERVGSWRAASDDQKEVASRRWIAAVNAEGRWGHWTHAVVRAKADVRPTIERVLAGQEAFS